jgi:cytochrome c-type biogenesis protein CcmF
VHVLMGVSIFFAFLVASIANPFAPVYPVPPDGPGPNPLLQNHWLMAVHPPMLYLGYVGMSVPFSMICASLLAGRLEAGWMAPVRRWMLVPWAFLSVGIVLGGWWSYAVLGWGGAWAWDPVENASFHPWLTGTAFLHSAMVLQRRNRMRDWTLVLGMATFLLTLLGTFMTRSGVFNSVHSFTQSSIGPVFLVFIGIVLIYSVVLLSLRSHTLDEASKETDQRLGSKTARGGGLWSREGAILVQNALFSVFTFMVLLGTLYPLMAEALQDRRVSVGEPYFDRWALPLGLGIVFMMGVGPAWPWGRLEPAAAFKRLAAPSVVGLVFAGAFAAAGFSKPFTFLALFTVGFAFWANLYEIVEPVVRRVRARSESPLVAIPRVLKKARRRFGGHVAHYGVLFTVFSLALAKGYRVERDFTMQRGDTIEFSGFDITFDGARLDEQPHRRSLVATFTVPGLRPFEPRMNYYPTQREPIYTPDVYESPTADLYFSIIEVAPKGESTVIRLIHQPFQMWMWWGAPIIFIGTMISVWPSRKSGGSK